MKHFNKNSQIINQTEGAEIGNILAVVKCIGILSQVDR